MNSHRTNEVLREATDLIKQEEGFRARAYQCSEGYITIGYGTKLHNRPWCMDTKQFCLKVSDRSASALLMDVLSEGLEDLLREEYSVMNAIPISKAAVLLSMQYQLGTRGLLGFNKMWIALRNFNYIEAERQALDSKWADQTPARALRHAEILGEPTYVN